MTNASASSDRSTDFAIEWNQFSLLQARRLDSTTYYNPQFVQLKRLLKTASGRLTSLCVSGKQSSRYSAEKHMISLNGLMKRDTRTYSQHHLNAAHKYNQAAESRV